MANAYPPPATQAAQAVLDSPSPGDPKKLASAWGCLVLADDAQRRKRFSEAALATGWTPRICSSVGEAMRIDQRFRHQLTIVDLGIQSTVHKSTFLQFAGQLASPWRLLLVCDEPDENSAMAELQARQAGAWMYLPSPPFDEALNDLLHNARAIAEKVSESAGAV